MVAVNLRISERENSLLEEYAKLYNSSKTTIIKEALIEKLENFEDLKDAQEISKAIEEGKEKTYTLEEVEQQLGLE
jgi:RHH-type rel operon transcriptional repressor/antitoxin RelB